MPTAKKTTNTGRPDGPAAPAPPPASDAPDLAALEDRLAAAEERATAAESALAASQAQVAAFSKSPDPAATQGGPTKEERRAAAISRLRDRLKVAKKAGELALTAYLTRKINLKTGE